MAEWRSKKQIAANKLDREIFNLSRSLEAFARDFNETPVDGLSARVMGMRGTVRDHMHEQDRKVTA